MDRTTVIPRRDNLHMGGATRHLVQSSTHTHTYVRLLFKLIASDNDCLYVFNPTVIEQCLIHVDNISSTFIHEIFCYTEYLIELDINGVTTGINKRPGGKHLP